MAGKVRVTTKRTDLWGGRLALTKRKAGDLAYRNAGANSLASREGRLYDLIIHASQQIPKDAAEQLIATGDVMRYDRMVLDVLSRYQEQFAEVLRQQLVESGITAMRDLTRELSTGWASIGKAETPPLPSQAVLNYTFDATSMTAAEFARTQSAALVTNMVQAQREAIRDVVARAYTVGRTPQQLSSDLFKVLREVAPSSSADEFAKLFGTNMNGLTLRYEQAVIKRAETLAAQLASKGITGTKALEKIQKDTARYSDKLRRARARTIARTEMLRANNEGKLQSFLQAEKDGLISAKDSRKQWSTSRFDVCNICVPLAGQLVPLRQPFSNGRMTPPAHPNCRCTMNLVTNVKTHKPPTLLGGNAPTNPFSLRTSGFSEQGEALAAKPIEITLGGTELPLPDIVIPEPPAIDDVARLTTEQIKRLWAETRDAGVTVDLLPQYEEAVINYTNGSGWYSTINTELREPGLFPDQLAKIERFVDSLDGLIERAPRLPDPMRTYRGVKKGDFVDELLSLKEGDTFIDPAFVSTSFKPETAIGFAREDGLVLEIINPAQTRGLIPLAYRAEPEARLLTGELEWLLPRGTKFKVLSKQGNRLVVEVIEQSTPNPLTIIEEVNPLRVDVKDLIGDARVFSNVSRLSDLGTAGTDWVEIDLTPEVRRGLDAVKKAGERIRKRVDELVEAQQGGLADDLAKLEEEISKTKRRMVEAGMTKNRATSVRARELVDDLSRRYELTDEVRETLAVVVRDIDELGKPHEETLRQLFKVLSRDGSDLENATLKGVWSELLDISPDRVDVSYFRGLERFNHYEWQAEDVGRRMWARVSAPVREGIENAEETATKAWREATKAHRQRLTAAQEAKRQLVEDVLRASRSEFGTEALDVGSVAGRKGVATSAEVRAEVERHSRRLPKEWVEAFNKRAGSPVSTQVTPFDIKWVSRGNFDHYNSRINLSSGHWQSTLAHEFQHGVQRYYKPVYFAERSFLAQLSEQTGIRKAKWLGSGYKKTEKFYEFGMGDRYAWKFYSDGYTEVTTRGIEHVFFEGFATGAEAYADFMYGLLLLL